jgi:hypothetical protein
MFDRRDSIYAQLGVPKEREDALTRWERMRPQPEPKPRERKLDIAPPTLSDIDQRIAQSIAVEHELMISILTEIVAQLPRDAAPGPSGLPGPPGPPGVPGKLPVVKVWKPETVFYEGEVATFNGGTFQAIRDTGQPPTHRDWICLAVAGHDAKAPRVRGVFSAEAQYQKLDIVAHGGGSFIARRDDPGPCPGDGWQSLTTPGKRGEKGPTGPRGEKGPRGDRGPAGPIIASWEVDYENYRARAIMSDGTVGGTLDLRGMFERYHSEAC